MQTDTGVTQFEFDKNEFQKFLEDNLDTKFSPCTGGFCPIAKFIRHKGYTVSYTYSYRSELQGIYIDHPTWVVKFIESFDSKGARDRTGEEALQIFNNVNQNEN